MKIAMLFPGYGSQYVTMIKELYDDSRVVQEYFEEASNCLNINFVRLCFAASDVELATMEHAYPALFLVSSALAAVLKSEGIIPHAVTGYGTGIFAAAHSADVVSFPDGLYLLSKYAHWFSGVLEKPHMALKIHNLPNDTVAALCRTYSFSPGQVAVAIRVAHDHSIVTGNADAVEQVRQEVLAQAGKVDSIPVEGGLYSAAMSNVVEQLSLYAHKVDFKDATIPVIETRNAHLVHTPQDVKDACIEQVQHTIDWQKVLEKVTTEYDLVIEVGPGNTLTRIINEHYTGVECMTINSRADIMELQKIITG